MARTAEATIDDRDRSRRATPRRSRMLVLAAMTAGSLLALLSLRETRPVLLFNLSASLPLGLYRITDADPHVGDIVAIGADPALETLRAASALPDRPLLKRIGAAGGAQVCRTGDMIAIDGVLAARLLQEAPASLPRWRGCRRLAPGELFVIGDHPRSLDSRYFGPIEKASLVGLARPLLTFGASQ